jgi:release factor glutamine methyltransferase
MSNDQSQWTILTLLRWTTGYFEEKGVAEPRASAEILLAHTLGLSRLDLYLRHDQPLTPEELARFKALIVRRRLGEPVAYLTGHKEFWSLDFLVTPATLIPRPETEVLVEAVLNVCGGGGQRSRTPPPSPIPLPPTHVGAQFIAPSGLDESSPYEGLEGEFEGRAGEPLSPGPLLKSSLALDLGAGSGALVVALARELPELSWLAVDISAAAIEVARENARRHGVGERIAFLLGDLLSPFKPRPWFRLLVANLPYVPRGEWEKLPGEIRDYEPQGALLGGGDGLDLIKRLCGQAHQYLQAGGWLGLEVGAGQAGQVRGFLEETGAYDTLKIVNDLLRIPRVVLARRRESA